MSLSYAKEKLSLAIDGMATSPKTLQNRLADAYIFHLINIQPKDDLPINLHSLYFEIRDAMTKLEAIEDEGKVQATVNWMTDDEAIEIARKISQLDAQVQFASMDSNLI